MVIDLDWIKFFVKHQDSCLMASNLNEFNTSIFHKIILFTFHNPEAENALIKAPGTNDLKC